MDSPAPQRRTHLRIVKAVCPHDCPDTCAMEIAVEDGKAVSVRGGDMPFTAGTLCTKVARYLDRTYAPSRILYPMKRIGRKGEGRFARISWYEALDTIAARFKAVAAENPQQILPVSYAGTMGMVNYASMDRRFFHRLGASLLERTLCSSAGKAGSKITLGGSVGSDPEQAEHSKLIIIWGSNPVISNLHFWTRCQQAKRRGAKLVIIDPRRNETAEKCHQHIALYPGTDAALALAMMHVIIVEGLTDADYIDKHTLGYTELVARVQEWTPQRAAAICGITPEEIINLAREYARTRPAMIRINFGLQRHAGGGMAVRTITCLPALTGSWRDAAGGVLLMTSDFYGFNHQALERPDLIRGKPRSINIAALGDALTAA
ncbi:MAG: molybdopterin-dependent oxidoreductase, partial [Burkholderiales bacterium]